jgi:RNA polymerase sigma factor (sigma-70 family)
MTLRELLEKVEHNQGTVMPTAKKLREMNCPIVAQKETLNDSTLTVYQNGFALYQVGKRQTVFRADYCGGYIYFTRTGQTPVQEEFFLEAEWWVRLVMEGEDRMVHNQNVRNERNEVPYGEQVFAHEEEQPDLLGAIVRQELLEEAYSLMTEKQRLVVELYYLEQLTLQEIADRLDVTFQAVSACLTSAKKRVRKRLSRYQ